MGCQPRACAGGAGNVNASAPPAWRSKFTRQWYDVESMVAVSLRQRLRRGQPPCAVACPSLARWLVAPLHGRQAR